MPTTNADSELTANWRERIAPVLRPAQLGREVAAHSAHGRALAGWHEPLRVIYDHELILVGQGEIEYELAGRRWPCPADHFIIIPPGVWHASWNAGPKPAYRYWCHFDWTWQKPYADTPVMTFHPARPQAERYRPTPAFVPPGILQGEIRHARRVYDLAERLAVRMRGEAHEQLTARGLLLELLLELFPAEAAPPPAEPRQRLASQCRELLNRLAWQGQTEAAIRPQLEKLGFSYAHLCRVFKATYGIPPLRYVNQTRLGRAQQFLKDTPLTVAEIAHRVGFHDPAYFGELFRRAVGQTPGSYRRSHG